jgi:hypothetical protein
MITITRSSGIFFSVVRGIPRNLRRQNRRGSVGASRGENAKDLKTRGKEISGKCDPKLFDWDFDLSVTEAMD